MSIKNVPLCEQSQVYDEILAIIMMVYQLAVRVPFGEHIPNLICGMGQLRRELRSTQALTVRHS